jgi:hypothetical protein
VPKKWSNLKYVHKKKKKKRKEKRGSSAAQTSQNKTVQIINLNGTQLGYPKYPPLKKERKRRKNDEILAKTSVNKAKHTKMLIISDHVPLWRLPKIEGSILKQ